LMCERAAKDISGELAKGGVAGRFQSRQKSVRISGENVFKSATFHHQQTRHATASFCALPARENHH